MPDTWQAPLNVCWTDERMNNSTGLGWNIKTLSMAYKAELARPPQGLS
jgi:hypothetical protein